MTQDLLSHAMRKVPRYTSYPTAPHFHDGVTGEIYSSWLSHLSSEDRLSLYLHVPYCRELCHYCGCHTKATRQEAPLTAYAKTLCQEIMLVRSKISSAGPVNHIHWGGGTPSLLPRESFVELAGLLRVEFDLAHDIEHAIELDPRLVTPALAETLALVGINRVSLGVQDFNLEVQKAIGRVQSFEVVKKAVDCLRAVGLNDLNFDLMYGLPLQSVETISDTIEKTVSLDPSRIALFGYAHVPWMRKHQKLIDEQTLPSAADRLTLADFTRNLLTNAGYIGIGLDHFALPSDSMATGLKNGSLKRNFQGYTTDQGDQLLGFGVSSIGKLSSGFVQNQMDVRGWRRSVEAGNLPISKGLALSVNDRLRGRIIEEIITNYGCDLAPVCRSYGIGIETLQDAFSSLDELMHEGIVKLERNSDQEATLKITEAGRPYVRLAAAAFDTYLSSNKAQHSAAV